MKLPALFAAFALLASATAASAQDSKLGFKENDTVATVLTRQVGQSVELRLRNGEKMGGKVVKVGNGLVHLNQLTSQEFFEAAVALDSIAAVVVRAK